MTIFVVCVLLGLCAGTLLFRHTRQLCPLRYNKNNKNIPRISVIIPARNEEHNIPGLLQSLAQQTVKPYEIICIDDGSIDATAALAKAGGAQVIHVQNKPHGWMGKSYACHLGAKAARGTLFLFLDADVRLYDKNTLNRIIGTWQAHGPVVSVQPWHATVCLYEQCCLFFNAIATAALAVPPLFGKATHGLFGPVILIPAKLYKECGGHEAVKSSVLDDISLGKRLASIGISPYCCQGGPELRYRMYPSGATSMIEGWTKNFASGAATARLNLWLLLMFWMSALLSVPFALLDFTQPPSPVLWVFLVLCYFILCFQLLSIARKIGRFSPLLILFYPFPLFVFLLIFMRSIVKKTLRRPVYWKGRNVSAGN